MYRAQPSDVCEDDVLTTRAPIGREVDHALLRHLLRAGRPGAKRALGNVQHPHLPRALLHACGDTPSQVIGRVQDPYHRFMLQWSGVCSRVALHGS